MKSVWKNVKEELPDPGVKVLKYTSEINVGQRDIALSVVDGHNLRYADETIYWCYIPELPVPLKTL